jgi:hypothetical protein
MGKMKSFGFAWIALMLAAAPIAGVYAADTTYTITDAQLKAYQQQLFDEIKKQEQFVQSLQDEMARHDVVKTYADSARYENAVTMLDVKRTLVNNFVGTQSLQSPAVRSLLLSILQKELITPGDLAGLQNLVNSEKAKMQALNPPTVPAPGPTGATVPQPSQVGTPQ